VKARSRKSRRRWSYTAGARPHSVIVFERRPGGVIYEAVWDPTLGAGGEYRKRSLGHRDRERAIAHAESEARLLRAGLEAMRSAPTVAGLIALYLANGIRDHAPSVQAEDHRRGAMWTRILGGRRVDSLGAKEWADFRRRRASGEIDGRGRTPAEAAEDKYREATQRAERKAEYEAARNAHRRAERARERRGAEPSRRGGARRTAADRPAIERPKPVVRPVRARTVDADLMWMVGVLNWSLQFSPGDNGHLLIEKNPWGAVAPGVKRALARPVEGNPLRPLMLMNRHEALCAVAPRVMMRVRGEGDVPSYLPELLELAEDNGRRITAIVMLSSGALRYSATEQRITHVTWPPLKREAAKEVPVSAKTAAVLARVCRARGVMPGVGRVPLFPAPRDPSRPVSRHLAYEWLRKAEALAGLEHMSGGGWHTYRRKWSTERKHHPEKDVMAVGGWKDPRSLRESYIHADADTMEAVVNEPRKLRERKA
jgi:hypothetical protein